jgi:lipoprotein-releasing system ATP-binding protein
MNNTMKGQVILSAQNICKGFSQGGKRLDVLKSASLELGEGEIVALVGQSGSGKSTFLQIIGLLDKPDSGQVYIRGTECAGASDAQRTQTRRDSIGVVYQYHHLLPEFSALENVILPQMLQGKSKQEATSKAETLLDYLGLKLRMTHRPAELSGGEQQRVAIARALVNRPAIVLADEPTGNLDPSTAKEVYQLLLQSARDYNVAVLFVTHNRELANQTDRIVTVHEGQVLQEGE